MTKDKKRPTLEQLRELPEELLFLEVAHIGVEAAKVGQLALEIEATNLMDDPDISPEKVVALREKLKSASGGTVAKAS